MKQPDIEIYLKDTTLPVITDWLKSQLGDCSEWIIRGKVYHCHSLTKQIPISFYQQAVGSWHCLYLANNETPWANDLDCAIAANAYLNIEIRCAPDAWSEEAMEAAEQADIWLKISHQEVTKFIWKTHRN